MEILKKIKNYFSNGDFPLLAFDISKTSIEIMKLKKELTKPHLDFYSRIELDIDYVKEGKIDELVKLISKQITDQGAKRAIFSLPDSYVYFLNLKTPKNSENWQEIIMKKAAESLPINLENCAFDYQIVYSDNEKTEVLFVASEKSQLKIYSELFQKLNLQLLAVDFEAACLARALIDKNDLNPATFIVDLGDKESDIILIDQGGFRDQITIKFGGNDIAKKISDSLKISEKEAEDLKKQKGLNINNISFDEIFSGVFSEIKKMSENYNKKVGQSANKIILAGGTALLLGLAEYFQKNLPGIAIEIGKVDKKIDFGDKLAQNKLLYGNVAGLALHGLDEKSLQNGINLIKNI